MYGGMLLKRIGYGRRRWLRGYVSWRRGRMPGGLRLTREGSTGGPHNRRRCMFELPLLSRGSFRVILTRKIVECAR